MNIETGRSASLEVSSHNVIGLIHMPEAGDVALTVFMEDSHSFVVRMTIDVWRDLQAMVAGFDP